MFSGQRPICRGTLRLSLMGGFGMTRPKSEYALRGDRTPAYVDRETGAAELRISPGTWDEWVKDGRLPKPAPGFPTSTPRWRWEDVDRLLAGRGDAVSNVELAIQRAANFASKRIRRRSSAPPEET
jgi:hypothetical protein